MGSDVSESFLGVSELDCSNLTVGSDAYISGDVSCNTLNGSIPLTVGNIDSYAATKEELNSLEDFLWGMIIELEDRVTELENA